MSTELSRSQRWPALLLAASRQALQWRLLLLWSLAQALPALLVCLPLWAALAAELDHALLGVRLLHGFDVPVYLEAIMSLRKYGYAPASGFGGVLLFVLMLPWFAGTSMAAARADERLRFTALFYAGLSEYWRMTRLWIWALVPVGLAVGVGAGGIYLAKQYSAKATLEVDADHALQAAVAVAALLFVLARASLDAACARLLLEPQRRSVVAAWWRGSAWLLRRPWRVLPYLLLTAAGLSATALLGWLRLQIPAVGPRGLITAFMLGQALVVVLAWMRCARLFALVAVGSVSATARRPTTAPQLSMHSEPGENGSNDDDQTDDVDNAVHDLSR